MLRSSFCAVLKIKIRNKCGYSKNGAPYCAVIGLAGAMKYKHFQ